MDTDCGGVLLDLNLARRPVNARATGGEMG